MTTPRNLRAAPQPLEQTVDAAMLVAHSVLGLYPVPDIPRRLESPTRHLFGQLTFLFVAQKAGLAPASHLVRQRSFSPSVSVTAHPRLDRSLADSHSPCRLCDLPSRPHQPKPMHPRSQADVTFCLVGCLQRLRRILCTPLNSKWPTNHSVVLQRQALVGALFSPLEHR